ncbi:exonuclease 1 isoform X2 [Entelurus aequoreus]|uniref:exonuclease 1 isoform X2 n=1 Tax=Entelurus aequoreus TaxID=161455 RepID=UPI002B1E738E|nr:exonuclease 1 isoform X2 [Entelurus aequoreus]
MGIQGLLQFIKDAGEPINVKKYKGQTVAVDTYCWLHKGAFSCAEKLAKGEPTVQYVSYCMKYVDMLLTFGVKPILVFDGRNLPSKREVEKARRERREANLQKGRQLLREGKLSEARDCFTRCVNITPAMAHNLIKTARAKGVDCVVAPYEADAQLAYLTKCGLAHAVITEDSDLLAFGCKKVILKMDKQGNGLEIDQSNLGRCRALGNVFTEEKFRYMCILSGCDYLASLHGIGLGKACKLLRIASDPNILKVIRKMNQYLKMNLVIPEEYIEGFVRANQTFLYQLVFDPVNRKLVPLNAYPEDINPATLSYAGVPLGDNTALQMALGNLDINTQEKIDDYDPDIPMAQSARQRSHSWNENRVSAQLSIWSRKTNGVPAPQPATALDRPPSTRGKERIISLAGVGLPLKNVQAKRPRLDISLSDQDVLQQYSSSSMKRAKTEQQQPDDLTQNGQPRPRNRFATVLQMRNQDADENGPAISSRFFSNSSPAARDVQESAQVGFSRKACSGVKDTPAVTAQTSDSDGPDVSSVETPSPPPSPNTTIPRSGSQGLRLFNWSGCSPSMDRSQTPKSTSGLNSLQHFQYKKDSFSISTKSPTDRQPDDEVNPTTSQDSAYFSQSQPSLHIEEALSSDLNVFHEEHAAPKMESKEDSEHSPTCSKEDHKATSRSAQATPNKVKSWDRDISTFYIAGLPKPKLGRLVKDTQVQALGAARASGLRKKTGGFGRKSSNSNIENNPGVQATISCLWKNYSFKKDTQRMTSFTKEEPVYPLKGNLLAS